MATVGGRAAVPRSKNIDPNAPRQVILCTELDG